MELQLQIGLVSPLPIPQATERRVSLEAGFEARKMGTSEVTSGFRGVGYIGVHMRPLLGLCRTFIRRAAIEPAAGFIAQGLLANPAAFQVKAIEASASAESPMMVINRGR
jgi:hypothetical protein